MIRLILVTAGALALCVALMSVRVILKKGGRFSMGHACRHDAAATRRRPADPSRSHTGKSETK